MDFSWLNELPESAWLPDDGGDWYLPVALVEFVGLSGLANHPNWSASFDDWGGQQPRQYSWQPVPGDYIWIFAKLDRRHPHEG